MPKGKGYGSKYAKSGQGAGGSKLGPRHSKPATAKSPKQPKAKTTTTSDYKAPKPAGSSKRGSTRTAYGEKGAGKTSSSSNYKAPKAAGSKKVSSHAGKTTGKGMKY